MCAMNSDSKSIALAKIQSIYMKKQPKNITEMLDFANLQEKIKAVCGDDAHLNEDGMPVPAVNKKSKKSAVNQEEQEKMLQELEDKIQEQLEQEALDLSPAEINDLQFGNQNQEGGNAQIGSISAINRYRKNQTKKNQQKECKRILNLLEKVDPKRELLDKLNEARKLNPNKVKQDIIEKYESQIQKPDNDSNTLVRYLHEYEQRSFDELPREEKEQYMKVLMHVQKKGPTPPPDKIADKAAKKKSIKMLELPVKTMILTKKDKEAQDELDRIHNSKAIKQEIKEAQRKQKMVLINTIQDQLNLRRMRKEQMQYMHEDAY